MQITLPWPPSVNHYWIRTRRGMTRSKRAKAYLHEAGVALICQGHSAIASGVRRGPLYAERLRVRVVAHPPDRRRRDLDNLGKAVCDALEHFRLCRNDSQIDDWQIIRGERLNGGKLVVTMEAIR